MQNTNYVYALDVLSTRYYIELARSVWSVVFASCLMTDRALIRGVLYRMAKCADLYYKKPTHQLSRTNTLEHIRSNIYNSTNTNRSTVLFDIYIYMYKMFG